MIRAAHTHMANSSSNSLPEAGETTHPMRQDEPGSPGILPQNGELPSRTLHHRDPKG